MGEVEQRTAVLESQMVDVRGRLDTMEARLEERLKSLETKVDKFGLRPTWGVTVGFSALTSACVGLAITVAQLA